MKQMYLDLDQKDLFWFETLCEEAGVQMEIHDDVMDGVTRYFFDEVYAPTVEKILDTPEANRPRQRKADLTEQIAGAQDKAKSSDNAFVGSPAVENRWAEEKLTEELKQIQAANQEPAETAGKQRKKRKSKGRTNQIMTRLTDAELVQFQRRVKKAGLAQGEFLRSAALNGQIVIEDHSVADVAMLDELAMIRADLGRQGGLLKMIIKPNEGQRELAPEEWAELIGAVRDMEQIKKRLSDLEVRVQHGNRKTQNQ